jgi:hypothetical protein
MADTSIALDEDHPLYSQLKYYGLPVTDEFVLNSAVETMMWMMKSMEFILVLSQEEQSFTRIGTIL